MRAVTTAAITAAKAAWSAGQVHKAGEVPQSPATPYMTVSADGGTPGNYLLAGLHGSRTFRISVQAVGKTHGEVEAVCEKADDTFLDRILTIPGWTAARARREITPSIRRDPDGGGLMYALATYTFEATPEETP